MFGTKPRGMETNEIPQDKEIYEMKIFMISLLYLSKCLIDNYININYQTLAQQIH